MFKHNVRLSAGGVKESRIKTEEMGCFVIEDVIRHNHEAWYCL